MKRAARIYGYGAQELGGTELLQRRIWHDPGVVDQDVASAERRDCGRHDPFARCRIGHIGGDCDRRSASRFDLLDHTLRRVVILGIPRPVLVVFGTTDVIHDDRGAPARQQPGELTTEPSTGSGDHDNSSVEAQRFAVPWVLSH
jgi:hypothetical protein